ncbi:hypothetical protein MTP99_011195 [Tenebrio molitor]|nr:hypothetical protein MTP99_011195 [Tenebrio molitor]
MTLFATIFLSGSQSKTGNLPPTSTEPTTLTVVNVAQSSQSGDSSPSLLSNILFNNKILRGTKWCGYRNVATSRNDLGIFEKTDACCRNHDLCPDNIHSGETKHRLLNTDSYTASNCDCDEKFFSCLKDIGSVTSYIVGFGYFTGLGLKCFRRDYPIVECKQSKKRCVEYRLDQTAKKVYQWFDNPLF